MLTGVLIAESIRAGGELTGVPLQVNKIWRSETPLWTLLEFSAAEAAAGDLAAALAGCLAPGAWYVDFHTVDEKFVVFADRVFRYPRGDAAGRAEAEEYGRSVGVPDAQLDWQS